MLHTLESDALTVSVSATGAELQSIFSKKTGTEYLWQGDPAFWGSRAPVLFPVIGGLKDGAYTFDKRTYRLPKHGFVRRADFHGSLENEKLVFTYADNPQTREVFPFAFIFSVIFSLQGNTLYIENRVENKSPGVMYFGVGAHEAYRCPRMADECFDDYYIEFEHPEPLESLIVSPAGLLSGESYPVALTDNRLPLKHSLFDNDALIFKNIKNKKLAVKSQKYPAAVKVTYDSPHLGVWTKPGAPFICIEPWCGLPDFEHSNQVFAHKEGNMRLDEGESFVFNHSVAICE
jgi:galactose mutarotase-like enzyme